MKQKEEVRMMAISVILKAVPQRKGFLHYGQGQLSFIIERRCSKRNES